MTAVQIRRLAAVRMAADAMADATAEQWRAFVVALGGDAAARGLAAFEEARPSIEWHVASGPDKKGGGE